MVHTKYVAGTSRAWVLGLSPTSHHHQQAHAHTGVAPPTVAAAAATTTTAIVIFATECCLGGTKRTQMVPRVHLSATSIPYPLLPLLSSPLLSPGTIKLLAALLEVSEGAEELLRLLGVGQLRQRPLVHPPAIASRHGIASRRWYKHTIRQIARDITDHAHTSRPGGASN